MIEEINEDVLFTELDKKQDVMLNTKQGFFTDAEGSPCLLYTSPSPRD